MAIHQITLISSTKRIRLVPPDSADDEAVSILRSHPLTLRYLRFLPANFSLEDARKRRDEYQKDSCAINFHIHAVENDTTSTFVGTCSLKEIDVLNDACSIGILVSPKYHRGGLATDALYTLLTFAFENQNLHRVTFDTGVDNMAMRGWLENVVGSKEEFRWRERWKDGPGQYVDVVGYSILEQEWRGSVKSKLERRLALKTY